MAILIDTQRTGPVGQARHDIRTRRQGTRLNPRVPELPGEVAATDNGGLKNRRAFRGPGFPVWCCRRFPKAMNITWPGRSSEERTGPSKATTDWSGPW